MKKFILGMLFAHYLKLILPFWVQVASGVVRRQDKRKAQEKSVSEKRMTADEIVRKNQEGLRRQVLLMHGGGMINAHIAEALKIDLSTVRKIVADGVGDNTEGA